MESTREKMVCAREGEQNYPKSGNGRRKEMRSCQVHSKYCSKLRGRLRRRIAKWWGFGKLPSIPSVCLSGVDLESRMCGYEVISASRKECFSAVGRSVARRAPRVGPCVSTRGAGCVRPGHSAQGSMRLKRAYSDTRVACPRQSSSRAFASMKATRLPGLGCVLKNSGGLGRPSIFLKKPAAPAAL